MSLFPESCPLSISQKAFSESNDEARAAIFTRQEVVDFMLDIMGYKLSSQLHTFRLLEPSFGHGQFLITALERLLVSCDRNHVQLSIETLGDALCGVELNPASYERVRAAVSMKLIDRGVTESVADQLCNLWLFQGDFLLCAPRQNFTHVVGNPPYLRHDAVPPVLMSEYRARFTTIFDRADLYVPFFEHSLNLLDTDGKLGFICADRWMKNKYGAKLRRLIAENYHLDIYVDMVDTPAFLSDVIAYPAITVISSENSNVTRVARRPKIDKDALNELATTLTAPIGNKASQQVKSVNNVAAGSEPWILENLDALNLVRRLEREFPSLEAAGCKIGIGVATGADKAFIGEYDTLDVESSRKIPLATTKDIASGTVNWLGLGVINPFEKDGSLVDLEHYPKLKKYLNDRYDIIAKRHVAKKNPAKWFKTIDKINIELLSQPKLLIPDIKGEALIVREDGNLYPHHNLYYISSQDWDIGALQFVLKSGIARLFVSTYSTKMRGGYLRFQAQYLRRIRLPLWSDISDSLQQRLIRAGENNVPDHQLIQELFDLNAAELALIANTAEISHAA